VNRRFRRESAATNAEETLRCGTGRDLKMRETERRSGHGSDNIDRWRKGENGVESGRHGSGF